MHHQKVIIETHKSKMSRIVAGPLMRNLHYSVGIFKKNLVLSLPRAFERIFLELLHIMAFLSLEMLTVKFKDL